MAGDLVADFPDLLQSNPPRIRVSGSPTSRVSPRVDLMELLEKVSIPTTESTIEGPAVKQFKDLNQEVSQLKWLLAAKEKLLVSEQPDPAYPGPPVRVSPPPKGHLDGPVKEGISTPGLIPEQLLRVSMCSERNVAFDLLDEDLRKVFSHLQFGSSDDTVARQIKALSAENLVLRQKAEDNFSKQLLADHDSFYFSFWQANTGRAL